MERVSIVKSKKGQAIRLLKSGAFPDTVKQVDIVIQEPARILLLLAVPGIAGLTVKVFRMISWPAASNLSTKSARHFDVEVHARHQYRHLYN